eukprot:2694117-Rhodomonas_salina.2
MAVPQRHLQAIPQSKCKCGDVCRCAPPLTSAADIPYCRRRNVHNCRIFEASRIEAATIDCIQVIPQQHNSKRLHAAELSPDSAGPRARVLMVVQKDPLAWCVHPCTAPRNWSICCGGPWFLGELSEGGRSSRDCRAAEGRTACYHRCEASAKSGPPQKAAAWAERHEGIDSARCWERSHLCWAISSVALRLVEPGRWTSVFGGLRIKVLQLSLSPEEKAACLPHRYGSLSCLDCSEANLPFLRFWALEWASRKSIVAGFL